MTTEERLETLEKELTRAKRRNRRLLAVAGLVAGAFALVWIVAGTANRAEAQGGGVPTVIRARQFVASQFVLKDENGKVRGVLAAVKGAQAALLLLDENGKMRTELTVDEDGPAALRLHDESGITRAKLSVGMLGARLRLYDENGKVIWQAP